VNAEAHENFAGPRWRIALGSVAVWAAVYLYSPHAWSGPVLCPLHGVVGLPCPSCGLTRALTALAHGDVVTALWWNALSLPVAALLLITPVVALYELATQRRLEFYKRWLFSQRVATVCAACVITYHLVRSAVWWQQGVIAEQFFRTSWSYRLFERFFSGL
jgi:hypothetical protein